MQLLDEEDLAVRKEYYDLNSIAYVARPPHSTEFVRAGRFKKASNLNYALELSIRVEEMMNERRPATTNDSSSLWTNDQEDSLYKEVLAQALIDRTKMMNVKEYPEGRSTGDLPKGRKAKKEEKEKRKREEAMVVEKERAVGPWCAGNIRMGEFVLLIDSVNLGLYFVFVELGAGGKEGEERMRRVADFVSFLFSSTVCLTGYEDP